MLLTASQWDMLFFGALTTLGVSLTALVCGVPAALIICFAKVGSNPFWSRLARLYISFFRGTPLLVQLLIVFYLAPVLNLNIPPFAAAVAALTFNTAAFQAEIFRGGLLSIPAGQAEAGQILGMSPWQIRRRILIPQMFRLVLPSFINELILVLKGSSLVSVIAVTDLTRVGQQIVAVNFDPLKVYLICGAIYFAMTFSLGSFGRMLERWVHLKQPGGAHG